MRCWCWNLDLGADAFLKRRRRVLAIYSAISLAGCQGHEAEEEALHLQPFRYVRWPADTCRCIAAKAVRATAGTQGQSRTAPQAAVQVLGGKRLQDKDAERTGQVARPLGINARDQGVQRLAVPRRDGF